MPPTNEAEARKMPAPQGAKLTVREVFTRLEDRALLSSEQKSLALKILAPRRVELLQGITVLTTIGAWLAAFAFTASVCILLEPKGGRGIMVGLGYCVGATLLTRIARHDFFVQAALAILLAGYGIVLFSVHESVFYSPRYEPEWETCAAAVLLAAVLYVVYDYPLQRFLVPLGAFFVILTAIWAQYATLWLNGSHPLVLVETLGVLLVFAGPTRWTAFRPLGHALAVALAVTVAPLTFPQHNASLFGPVDIRAAFMVWPSKALLAAALAWLTCWAARQAQPQAPDAWSPIKRPPVLVALGAIVLLGIVSSPGILAGFLLAALGHATRERLLALLGLLVLVGAVTLFCCDYELVLSARAGLLVASGLVLLSARFVLWRLTAPEAKKVTP